MTYTLNLAQLPAGCGEEIRPSIDFISWICEQYEEWVPTKELDMYKRMVNIL